MVNYSNSQNHAVVDMLPLLVASADVSRPTIILFLKVENKKGRESLIWRSFILIDLFCTGFEATG